MQNQMPAAVLFWGYTTKRTPERDRSTNPQKAGSDRELLRGRLQPSRRPERDLLRRRSGNPNGEPQGFAAACVILTKKIPAKNEISGFKRDSYSFLQCDFLISSFECPTSTRIRPLNRGANPWLSASVHSF